MPLPQTMVEAQQLAHAAFEAFLARVAALGIDDAETARLNAVLRMATYTPRDGTDKVVAPPPKGVSNGLKIRSYAA